MTVKIYRPEEIKDANLASSTLPEPDASRGEVEWQSIDERRFLWSVSPRPSGFIYDALHADGYGVYVLHGSVNNLRLSRYNLTGQLSHEMQIANLPGFERDGAGLSMRELTNNSGVVYIGVSDFKTSSPDADTYSIKILSYNVNKSNPTDISSAGFRVVSHPDYTSAPYGSYFWVKTNNPVDGLVIIEHSHPTAGRTIKSFDSNNVVLASITPSEFNSALPTESGRIFAISFTAFFSDGKRAFKIFELSGNLSIKSSADVESFGGNIHSSRLSSFGGYLSHSSAPSLSELNLQSFDYQGINIGSYKSGDEVIVTDTHKRYRAIKNAIFTYPPDNSQDGGDWIEVSPTNRWGMLDGEINTKSRSASGHTVNLTPSYLFDSVSVFGCKNVSEVRLTVRNSANAIIFQRNEDMNDLIAALEWQQDPLNPDLFSEVTIDGIPTAAGAKIELQFIGSNIEVGLVRYGLSREIGESLSGLSQDYFDYSKVEYNDFGKLIYQERPIVKLNTYNILVEREKTRSVDRLINSYRGQNLVWSGSTGNGEALVTYGRAQRSPLVYEYPNINELEITVRGSI